MGRDDLFPALPFLEHPGGLSEGALIGQGGRPLVLAVLAVLDILKKPISMGGKIISSVLVLITSWIGLLVYYLYAKNHLTEWFK